MARVCAALRSLRAIVSGVEGTLVSLLVIVAPHSVGVKPQVALRNTQRQREKERERLFCSTFTVQLYNQTVVEVSRGVQDVFSGSG